MGPARTSRRLLLAALLLLFGMTQVQAVGLGDIEVESFLNQHLKAKVWLLGLSKAEARKYTVSLASEADFRRSNIPFPTVLGTLRLRMSVRDSKPYVRILTTSPVREPFLRILITLKGPDSKIQKEFAVLLDPQGFGTASQPNPVAGVRSKGDAGESPNFTQAISPRKLPSRSISTPRRANSSATQYGPVKGNESLWSIAQRLRPNESVSMQQMMIALLNANPDAFDGSNINTLRKGSVLQVPNLAAIRRLDAITAFRQAKRQIDGPRRVAALKSSASKPDAAKRVAVGELQIEVTDARGKTSSSVVDSRTRAEQRIAAKARALEAELLGTLEPKVKDTVVAPTINNSEKASTQAEDTSVAIADSEASSGLWQPGVTTPMPGADVETDVGETMGAGLNESAESVITESTSTKAMESEKAGNTTVTQKLATKPIPQPAVSKTLLNERTIGEKTTGEKATAEKPKAIVPARIAPPPVIEPDGAFDGILDQLFADPTMLALAGGGLVGLLALIMLILRRRQKGADDDGYIDDESAPIMAESGGVDDGFVDPNAATTIMSASDAKGDVLTSAQEYINKGQLDDASRVLEQAVMAEPARDDLRMKLAEVYEQSDNSIGIDALIGQVPQDKRSDDNGLWRVLQAVGRKVSPENPALAVAGATAGSMVDTTMLQAQAPEDEMPDMLDLSDLGLDDDVFDLPELSSGGDSSSDAEIDFDLGDLDISGDAPEEFDLGDDFDLPDFGGDAEPATDTLVMDSGDMDERTGFADSELSLNDAAAADAGLDTESETSSDDAGLDFGDLEAELGSLDMGGVEDESAGSTSLDSDAIEPEFDLGGLDFGGDSTDDADLSGLDSLLADDGEGTDSESLDVSDSLLTNDDVDDDLANLAASLDMDEGSNELSADFGALAAATDDEALDLGLGLGTDDDLSLDGLELSSGDNEMEDLEAALAGGDTDSDFAMDTATLLVQTTDNDPLSETVMLGAAVDTSTEAADSISVDSSSADANAGVGVDLEEVDTKLDLARAYLDMGDPDGARTMLDEVVVEGSASQRQEAEGLIAQLG